MATHPAALMPFDVLYAGLEAACVEGLVSRKRKEDLVLYCYTKQCVFEKAWNSITKLARGLILCPEKKMVVAYPFPKFFNYMEEDGVEFPNQSFEVYEQLDGSLIIAYHWDGEWHCATKGSFDSEQAIQAQDFLRSKIDTPYFPAGTWLFEYVGPDNLIVVRYPETELRLLGRYSVLGWELDRQSCEYLASVYKFTIAKSYTPKEINALLQDAETLPSSEEGWVLRFSDGYRLKIKGAEYRRIHAALNHLTPLAV